MSGSGLVRQGAVRRMTVAATESAKKHLRKDMMQRLKRMSESNMEQESRMIQDHLHNSVSFQQARDVAVYVDCPRLREVRTTAAVEEALRTKDRVFVPRVLDRDSNMHFLQIHRLDDLVKVPPFGISEPTLAMPSGDPRLDALISDKPLDMVVMPGLAFDSQGRRLGRGGGYYDKFIQAMQQVSVAHGWSSPLLVALAFQAQMVEKVPAEEHDVPVDVIITPAGITLCTPRAFKEWQH